MVGWFEGPAGLKLERCTVAAATDYSTATSPKILHALNFQPERGLPFLATKVEEQRPLTTSDLCQLTEGVFTREDIRLVELELLCVLPVAPPPARH